MFDSSHSAYRYTAMAAAAKTCRQIAAAAVKQRRVGADNKSSFLSSAIATLQHVSRSVSLSSASHCNRHLLNSASITASSSRITQRTSLPIVSLSLWRVAAAVEGCGNWRALLVVHYNGDKSKTQQWNWLFHCRRQRSELLLFARYVTSSWVSP